MTIPDWIKQIIDGPGGMNDYERHEMVAWLDSDRYCAASWAIRCLANPLCEGSEAVLDAIMARREQVAAEERALADAGAAHQEGAA